MINQAFIFSLPGNKSPHNFTWMPDFVDFTSAVGSASDNNTPFESWQDAPTPADLYIPQKPLPFHLNLWLFQGQPPTDNQEVEIVITYFRFTAASDSFLPVVFK